MSNNSKRIVSYILTLAMLFTSVFTNTIFADDITDTVESIQEEDDNSFDSDDTVIADNNLDSFDENADMSGENGDSTDENADMSGENSDSINENTDISGENNDSTDVSVNVTDVDIPDDLNTDSKDNQDASVNDESQTVVNSIPKAEDVQSSNINLDAEEDGSSNSMTDFSFNIDEITIKVIAGQDGIPEVKVTSKQPIDGLMYGDVDGNKRLTALDSALVVAYIVENSLTGGNGSLTEHQKIAADVDGNPGINFNDASLILQKVLNADVEFDVPEIPVEDKPIGTVGEVTNTAANITLPLETITQDSITNVTGDVKVTLDGNTILVTYEENDNVIWSYSINLVNSEEDTTQPTTTAAEDTTQPTTTAAEDTTQPTTTAAEDTTQPTTAAEDTTQPTTTATEDSTQPTTEDTNLVIWKADDTELASIVGAITDDGGDAAAFEGTNGLKGYGKWTIDSSKPKVYTHTNGETYNFTNSFSAGKSGTNKRIFYFTPKQSCIVTVVYSTKQVNPSKNEKEEDFGVFITQGSAVSEHGPMTNTQTEVATITADIIDPSVGDVYIKGGQSGNWISAIFVDYYDPDNLPPVKGSGNIEYVGTTASEIDENVKIVFSSTKGGETKKYTADFKDGNTKYEVSLDQLRDYEISIEENGEKSTNYVVSLDTNSLKVGKIDVTKDIKIVKIGEGSLKGDIVVHDIFNDDTTLDLSNVTLTFTADEQHTYNLNGTDISNGSYKDFTIADGLEYEISATGIEGYELSPLSKKYTMVAGDTNAFKNILITEKIDDVEYNESLKTIQVGADKQFKTISNALKYVEAIKNRPAGEDGRITIEIDPGTYREQVIIKPSYITLKAADENNRPTVTFYYGIAYIYYSSNSGYYDEDYAVQKIKKSPVDRWGCTLRINGSNFIGENIIFENSFNCYMTDEEIADGVEAAGPGVYADTSNKPDRTVENYDARSKAATERAAAIAADGTNYELFKCDFISSQDTVYTNKNGYFKECYLEGMTDYIFGGNSVVFEDCDLAWHGYSTTADGGHLTACKTSGPFNKDNINTYGYLLKNCNIVKSKYYSDQNAASYNGTWGRNWGGPDCRVIYDGVTLKDVPTPSAWSKMGGELNTSILYVNNVKTSDGTTVDSSGTSFNPNGTIAEDPLKMYEYFGDSGWIPTHYTGDQPPVDDSFKLSMDFTGSGTNLLQESEKTTGIDAWLSKDNVRVEESDESAVWKFNGFTVNAGDTQGQHGLNAGTITVKVPGSVKISCVACAYGDCSIAVKNGADDVVKKSDLTKLGDGGSADFYYKGSATTLTIELGNYVHSIKIAEVADEDIPNDYTVTFDKGSDEGVTGIVPVEITAGVGTPITIPVNRTLYKEGYTLTGWANGDTTYNIGNEVTDITSNVTLTPVFTENDANILDNAYEVTFDFQRQNGAPVIGWQGANNSGGPWVSQTTINGKSVDVKLDVDATNGKLANANWNDWAQVNENTKFVLGSLAKDSTVTFVSMGDASTMKIDGTESTFTKSDTYKVTADGNITLVAGANFGYLRTITVNAAAKTGGSETPDSELIDVSGTITGGGITAISFVSGEKTYNGTLAEDKNSFTAKLPAGTYTVNVTAEGYTVKPATEGSSITQTDSTMSITVASETITNANLVSENSQVTE